MQVTTTAGEICIQRVKNLLTGSGNLPDSISRKVVNAIEIETELTDNVLDLLITTDGTIAPLFHYTHEAPEFIKDLAKEYSLSNPFELKWDSLWLDQKRELLEYLTNQRKHISFFDDRTFHGLRIRDKVYLRPTNIEEISILGQVFPANSKTSHEVDLTAIFGFPGAKVEYMSPQDISDGLKSLELHARSEMPASEFSIGITEFQLWFELPTTHQHMHMVAPIPIEILQIDPKLYSFYMAYKYEETNLIAEAITIVDSQQSINRVIDENGIEYFGSAEPQYFPELYRYLKDFAAGYPGQLGDDLKIAYVGARGADKYDGPILSWGLEYRDIYAAGAKPESMRGKFLDHLNRWMSNPMANTHFASFKNWFSSLGPVSDEKITNILSGLWYNQRNTSALIAKLPEELQLLASSIDFSKVIVTSKNERNLLVTSGLESKMALVNWANHPLTYNWSKTQFDQLLAAQRIALVELSDPNKTYIFSNQVISNFLKDSGLYEQMKLIFN